MSLLSSNSGTSVCIIGAGVIGCAIAYELGKAGYTVTVIDANAKPGQGITSRNSEVIHAGMYYPTDSLKAKLCVEGRILLCDYCKKFNVAHKQTGKIIIASSEQEIGELEKINQQALANGNT
jgi:L-2-hydroxyglutarate oxidase LhgO